jgi:AcrR family transcriptional regulator
MKPPSSAAPARSMRADARRNRERILEIARGQFAERGLDAQIDEIAREAGVGVGTVYRHFPTKEDLVRALQAARFEWLAVLARECLQAGDAWEGFSDFMYRSAELQAGDRALSEIMAARPEGMAEEAAGSGLIEAVEALVERAQLSGDLRADVVSHDVPMIMCGLGRATGVGPNDPSISWDRYLAIIIDGLRAPAAVTPLPPRREP